MSRIEILLGLFGVFALASSLYLLRELHAVHVTALRPSVIRPAVEPPVPRVAPTPGAPLAQLAP